jgi:NAD+ kinase
MAANKPNSFKHAAVLAVGGDKYAVALSQRIAAFLESKKVHASAGLLHDQATRKHLQDGQFDLVVALGGDGTMLRAGHICAPLGIPLIGINHGHFGFLIELDVDQWESHLPRLASGEYWHEERMMLQVQLRRGSETLGSWDALNEAMVGRGRVVRPVHLATRLDGRPLTTYVSDGLIVATPTGSTAYALAAGGPILPPTLRNILLVPVAAHLSVDRAIVVAEGASIEVELLRGDEAVLSVDGQPPVEMQLGDVVEARASQHTLTFLRFQEPGYFYERLLSLMDNNPATGAAKA